MDAALLLAGGRSRRSGQRHKACRRLPGEGRSWIDRQVECLRQAGFAPVYLLTGYRPRRVLTCLHHRVVRRHNFKRGHGPFSTLQVGLHNLSGAALVVPVDTILPPVPWLRRLRRIVHARDILAASPIDRWDGGGHPVMVSRRWAQSLHAVSVEAADARLDRQLDHLPATAHVRLPWNHFLRYPRLNTGREWRSARRRLRRNP